MSQREQLESLISSTVLSELEGNIVCLLVKSRESVQIQPEDGVRQEEDEKQNYNVF
jgi:hypothetical protein